MTGIHGSLRWRLREATAASHARVDAVMGALGLDTLGGYGDFLATVEAATAPLEDQMAGLGAGRSLPGWEGRRCSGPLRADLAGLGRAPVPLGIPPAPGNEESVLGMAYVLEGSRLGSRVLLGRVLAGGDALVAANVRHLRRCEDLGAWRDTLERIEALAGDGVAERAVLEGAVHAFAAFEAACAAVPGRTA